MGIYDPRIAYPPEFDEIDLTICENCKFDCDIHGYCKEEVDSK